jgi:hypothetical protein
MSANGFLTQRRGRGTGRPAGQVRGRPAGADRYSAVDSQQHGGWGGGRRRPGPPAAHQPGGAAHAPDSFGRRRRPGVAGRAGELPARFARRVGEPGESDGASRARGSGGRGRNVPAPRRPSGRPLALREQPAFGGSGRQSGRRSHRVQRHQRPQESRTPDCRDQRPRAAAHRRGSA